DLTEEWVAFHRSLKRGGECRYKDLHEIFLSGPGWREVVRWPGKISEKSSAHCESWKACPASAGLPTPTGNSHLLLPTRSIFLVSPARISMHQKPMTSSAGDRSSTRTITTVSQP